MAYIAYNGELKIASGFNNTAGYDAINELTDSDSIPFVLPNPLPAFTLGVTRPTLARRAILAPDKACVWTFTGMSIKQWYKLYDDYFNTTSSAVTVRSVDSDGSFDDFNAYIIMPMNWQEFLTNDNGLGTYKPVGGSSHKANFLANIPITFNIIGTAS